MNNNEQEKLGKLILIRHQESEWNKLGKWTGFTDVSLSPDGVLKAKEIGERIKDFKFNQIYISTLKRTKETLDNILESGNFPKDIKTIVSKELNERDYGDYTGMNKWEIKEKVGDEEFLKIRRGWDYCIPNGESLKMVYERSVPFFIDVIMKDILEGKNVLIVAHGNSIRSLIKYIENISDENISNVEMGFGDVLVYELDKEGHCLEKEIIKV